MIRTFMHNGAKVDQVESGASYPFSSGPLKITNVLCADGVLRTARLSTKGADTFFSIPASVKVRGKSVSGYVTVETVAGFSTESADDPSIWHFRANTYGKNHALIVKQAA